MAFRRLPPRARRHGDRRRFEAAALEIDRVIEADHWPFGTIADPIFAAPDSREAAGYARAGDSAIWTGHYLAAECYRWAATYSGEAWWKLRAALAGIRRLVDVTGADVLARCALPLDAPFTEQVARSEEHNGIWEGETSEGRFRWIGNTSRDQYLGVFFGLSVAFELIPEEEVRAGIRDLVTRMLQYLLRNNWFVWMPDGKVSTTFGHRQDQTLTLLQIGRQVNDPEFSSRYRRDRFLGSRMVALPIAMEVLNEHDSYFKFNLDAISLFRLIHNELSGLHRGNYLDAYGVLRRTIESHGNAHFNMIDRAVRGPDERRDRETLELLAEWLLRPRRDFFVDNRGRYPACGENRSCQAIPVKERVTTDFLWQRSPFQLYGGGNGFIENPGVDFLLPYWMARYYWVL